MAIPNNVNLITGYYIEPMQEDTKKYLESDIIWDQEEKYIEGDLTMYYYNLIAL